jgi:Flp pilus assembly protein TadD
MADVAAIMGVAGGLVGLLGGGGGVFGLWRSLHQEKRDEAKAFFETYDQSIAILRIQYERETDATDKHAKQQRLEAVEIECHEQLAAYRQNSALRQSAPRRSLDAEQPPLPEAERASLTRLLSEAEPLSAALVTASDYFLRGNTAYELGRYEEAFENYNRSLELRPDDPRTLQNRGAALNQLGRYDGALADFNRSLELRPNFVNPVYNKACLFSLTNRLEEALTQLAEAIRLDNKYKTLARTDEDFDNLRADPKFGPEFERLVSGDS